MVSANLKKRFVAFLIDYLLIVLWGIVLFAISMFIYNVVLDGIPKFDEIGMNLLSLTMIVPVILYSIIMEAGKKHATLGKQKMTIKVSAIDCNTVNLCHIIVRNIIKFLPWQFGHMMIFRGFALNWELSLFWMTMFIIADILPILWIAIVVIRKDHKGIYDLIAGTIVVDSFR